ncbi:hypothetical protein DT87_01135 [Streptomyces sp. NTK 937]|nr:hypothetical protein DT87_01135 [Streptomyces sp. NTK 937]
MASAERPAGVRVGERSRGRAPCQVAEEPVGGWRAVTVGHADAYGGRTRRPSRRTGSSRPDPS